MSTPPEPTSLSRRSFLTRSSLAAAGAGLLGGVSIARSRARLDDTLQIALVGCGGRGTGAAAQALSTAGPVKLVAMADAFRDRLDGSLQTLLGQHADKIEVPEERKFVGFDAYRQVLDLDLDVVILTTPPGFRPSHFEYAVDRGIHVFMEKPVAVDGPGIRRVLAAAAKAKESGLKVGVGLQRHHDVGYVETVKRLQEGAIGDLVLLRAYWDGGGVWVREREPGQGEMEYQMRNWYYFNWLCGDHIVEQHIHNLDVCNWVMDAYPVSAQGQGGRQVRVDKKYGEIFDHHFVEFTYASGTKLFSQCRHIPGTFSSVSEHAHGTEGTANIGDGRIEGFGGWQFRFREDRPNPYQVEHDRLFAAIRENTEHMEAEYGAKSTLTSILGRMATYSGKVVSWDEALNSELALVPSAYSWEGTPPTVPNENGEYPIPMPGTTRAF